MKLEDLWKDLVQQMRNARPDVPLGAMPVLRSFFYAGATAALVRLKGGANIPALAQEIEEEIEENLPIEEAKNKKNR